MSSVSLDSSAGFTVVAALRNDSSNWAITSRIFSGARRTARRYFLTNFKDRAIVSRVSGGSSPAPYAVATIGSCGGSPLLQWLISAGGQAGLYPCIEQPDASQCLSGRLCSRDRFAISWYLKGYLRQCLYLL